MNWWLSFALRWGSLALIWAALYLFGDGKQLVDGIVKRLVLPLPGIEKKLGETK